MVDQQRTTSAIAQAALTAANVKVVQGYNEVCCCGTGMNEHSAYDNHTPRCAKEYAVTCYVESKLKG